MRRRKEDYGQKKNLNDLTLESQKQNHEGKNIL